MMKMLPNLYWELPAGVQPPQGLKQQQEETPAAPGVSSPGTTMIMIMTTTMMIMIMTTTMMIMIMTTMMMIVMIII